MSGICWQCEKIPSCCFLNCQMSVSNLVTNEEAETPIQSFNWSVVEQSPRVGSRVDADNVRINESPHP